ncbi:MAG: GNAT family N-acetyltransferase [Thermoplasmata archaeon]
MIRRDELLRRYDREMREDPVPLRGGRVERVGRLVRMVDGENSVIYSHLNDADAPAAVAEEAEHFRALGQEVEWKVFGHDRPVGLEALLAASGFAPDEPETLVVFDLERAFPAAGVPPDVDVRRVTESVGVRDASIASAAAFGPEKGRNAARWAEFLHDPSQALFVAYAGAVPVACGRLEMTPGRSFAGLWGGGTAPAYRHRGIYRALLDARADLARRQGYRFLTVDARASSRPILERLGFVPLTSTRAWVLRPGAATARAAP